MFAASFPYSYFILSRADIKQYNCLLLKFTIQFPFPAQMKMFLIHSFIFFFRGMKEKWKFYFCSDKMIVNKIDIIKQECEKKKTFFE